MDEWKPIMGYENYEVSNLGNVRNVKSGKMIKPSNVNGYLKVTLYENGRNYKTIHRLVLQTFFPTKEDLECDHINNIKTDNRLDNLRWVTKSQNIRHRKKYKSSSQYVGVCWVKSKNKWRANCRIENHQKHLGYFDNEKDAGKAYNDFIIKHDLQHFVILNEII